MGVCYNVNNEKKNHRLKTEEDNSHKLNQEEIQEHSFNENSIIENKQNITIVKLIGQIKGNAIKIENNNNCVIMIMDYSSSCQIQKCFNCSIFIAPCYNSIIVRDCNNLNSFLLLLIPLHHFHHRNYYLVPHFQYVLDFLPLC